MPFSRTPGIAEPDELKVLESVFEEACRTSKITRDSAEAERMALKIMLVYQSGLEDRGQRRASHWNVLDRDREGFGHRRGGQERE